MIKRFRLNPVLCAAVGAVIGFYILGSLPFQPKIFFAVIIVLISILSLLRVLSSLAVQSRTLRLTSAYSIAFSVGIVLGVSAAATLVKNVDFGLPENTVTIVKGKLLEDPRIVSRGRAMAAVSLMETSGRTGVRARARGELTVFFPAESAMLLREFGRNSVVFAHGSLRESTGRGGWLFFAESLYIVTPAPPLERFRTGIRMDIVNRFDGFPWGGMALALLIGIRDNLDSNLTAMFRESGTAYLLALSGMHLAIIISIISFLLKKPLGIKGAAIAGAVIISLYCLVVGPMPSLDRSALMYLLGVLAVLGALPKEPLSLLGMAFLIQIAVSPKAGHSIAFTLSYMALAGILIVGEAVNTLLAGKAPAFICRSLCASIGAFLATASITAYFFGALRPIGIIVSLVLIPLITVFMAAALVWLALNFISPSLSGLLDLPLTLLYRAMEKSVSIGGAVPGIITSKYVLVLAVAVVISLFIVWLGFRRKQTANRLLCFS